MSPEFFRSWQDAAGLNINETADALGKSRFTIMRWRERGIPSNDSVAIRLAMSAVIASLPPWSPSK